jgi:hypothetical protein
VGLFVALAALTTAFGQPMLAFNVFLVSLIFVLRAIDAHGMVQEVHLYSDKMLFVRTPSAGHEVAKSTDVRSPS